MESFKSAAAISPDSAVQDRLFQLSFYVILINFVIESFVFYPEDRTLIISFQVVLNLYFFLRFFTIAQNYKPVLYQRLLLFIIIYFFFLGLFSSDLIVTYNYIFKFTIPLGYFFVGYNLFQHEEQLLKFARYNWVLLAYFCIYMIVVNVMGVGEKLYKEGVFVGFWVLNGLYIPTFSVIFMIFNFEHLLKEKRKYLYIAVTVLTILILIALLKRTLILMVLIGLLFYFLKNLSLTFLIRASVVIGIASIVFFSYFADSFFKSLESRSSRFSAEYQVTNEGRFTENIHIYNMMKDSPVQVAFGSGEVFNDRKALTALGVYEVEREAHNSYIRIFWSGGIVGLLLILIFYFRQFRDLLQLFIGFRKLPYRLLNNLLFFGVVLVLLRFLNDFSSGITYLTFNAYSYFILGGILSVAAIRIQQIKNSGGKPSTER